MGFNYAMEKRRFDAEWLRLAEQYRKAGFDETGIQAMRDFDWELFCQRRTYENREQELPSEIINGSDDGSNSTLFKKFPSLSITFDESVFEGRYDWINAMDDSVLLDKLSKLSDDDMELLTLFVFQECTQAEISVIQGCSQQAVSKRIKRIKLFLKQRL